MEQRDYLKDHIEQLGKVLGEIMAKFMGYKSDGQAALGMEIANKQLSRQLDIDVEKLTAMNKEEIRDYLVNKNLTPEYFEKLSDYLKETGESTIGENKTDAIKKLDKAYELLEIADEISKSMSFTRASKKTELENILKQEK